MSPLQLDSDDLGRTIQIETKTKSRPLRGTLVGLTAVGRDAVRLEVKTAFGTKAQILTHNDEVALTA